MNVFTEMAHAIYDVKSYPEFLKDRKRKTFFVGFLLALLYYALAILVPVGKFQLQTGGVVNMLDMYLPDFELNNGKLSVNRVFELEEGNSYVYVNTDEGFQIDEAQLKSQMKTHEALVVADSSHMVFQNNGRVQYMEFADLGAYYMTKSIMLKMVRPYVNALMWTGLILVFVFMELAFFVGTLLVTLVAMAAAGMMRSSLTFGQLYQMSVYARTAPYLLKAVVALLPFGVPFMALIGMAISLVYLVRAIRLVKEQEAAAAQEARNAQLVQDAWCGLDQQIQENDGK